MRETIGHLQKIFRLRTCDDTVFAHRSRPCLLHQIRRCSGPCVGLVDDGAVRARRAPRRAVPRGQGERRDRGPHGQDARARPRRRRYEEAAHYRDQIRMLQRILSGQAVEIDRRGRRGRHRRRRARGHLVRDARDGARRAATSAIAASSRTNASGSDARDGGRGLPHAALRAAAGARPRRVRPVESADGDSRRCWAGSPGGAVKLVTRPMGESRTWLDMARAQRVRSRSASASPTQANAGGARRGAAGIPRRRDADRSASSASTSATRWARRRSPRASSTTRARCRTRSTAATT